MLKWFILWKKLLLVKMVYKEKFIGLEEVIFIFRKYW